MWCVIGGVTSPVGAVAGAAFLSILPEVIRALADFREITNGIILLVVILFAPERALGAVAHAPRARAARCLTRSSSTGVGVRYGGVIALDDVSLDRPAGRDARPDRTQRRRQDDADQRHHRHRAARRRHDCARNAPARRARRRIASRAPASRAPIRTSGSSARSTCARTSPPARTRSPGALGDDAARALLERAGVAHLDARARSPRHCRTAISAGSRSRARWRRSRRS